MIDHDKFAQNLIDNFEQNGKTDEKFLEKTIGYILDCLDKSISYAEKNSKKGGLDKKILVISIMTIVYENTVSKILPIYLKPFESVLKYIIIQVIISSIIDFIVKKYKDNSWKGIQK